MIETACRPSLRPAVSQNGAASFPAARTSRRRSAAIRHIIIGLVARVFDVPADVLECRGRGPARTMRGRQIAINLAHVGVAMPLAEAGALFGRSRATAAHACRAIEAARDDDRSLDQALDLVAAAITISLARLR